MEDEEIMFSLIRVSGNINNYFNKRLKEYGVTSTQLSVLCYLMKHQNEVINQKHICKEFDISHSTAVGVITRMYGRNLIAVTISEVDRRNTDLTLTKHGIDVYNQTRGLRNEIVTRYQEALDDDLESFFDCVRKIDQVFK